MTESFSVATPVLNGLPYLRGCVGSVRGQTGITVEHLVRDGKSNDGTVEWLESQDGLNAVSQKDSGMYDAIGQAWAKSSGTVLSWLNADEQYLPDSLKLVAQAFERNPEVDLISGNSIIVTPEGDPLAARREIALKLAYLRYGPLYTLSCSLFFRRRLLDQRLLAFDPTLRYAADYDLILSLLESGCKTLHLDHYLSAFIVHDRNLSLDAKMGEEIQTVRQKHQISGGALIRRSALARRHLKKLRAGCYARERLVFQFAQDETPRYRLVEAPGVGSRFNWTKLNNE